MNVRALRLFSFLLCLPPMLLGQGSPLTLVQTIPLRGVRGRIDHLAIDRDRGLLFVAAYGNNSVEVVDLREGKLLRSIGGCQRPQGIAFLPERNMLAVTNEASGTCDFYDAASFHRVRSAHLGDDADNLRYDSASHCLYVGYGTGSIAALDESTSARLGDGQLGGHPEGFLFDRAGRKMFVNVPRHRMIAVLERPGLRRVGAIPLDGSGRNYPMALDERHHRVLVCLRNPGRLVFVNTETLEETGSMRIADGADDLSYDSTHGILYASCARGFIDVIRQLDADRYVLAAQIATAPGAGTSLFVPETRMLYLAVPRRGAQRAEIRVYRTSP
jgi:DNA-binding beta-propeller fold protein YncE